MEVIKWTFYGDEEYPEAEENDNQEECEDAIVREIQKQGYRFTGPAHQHHPYTVPVLSDGTRYECSCPCCISFLRQFWDRLFRNLSRLEWPDYGRRQASDAA